MAKLAIPKPLSLQAVDLNGDKKPDLVIGTAEGCRIFLATADGGYQNATKAWCPWGAVGGLLRLRRRQRRREARLPPEQLALPEHRQRLCGHEVAQRPGKVRPLAAALMDVTRDGK